MQEKLVTFNGEHLFIGNFGHALVVLSFVAALFGALFYFLSVRENSDAYRKIGRSLFLLHATAVAGVFITLFIIIQKHYYEYQYAWQHSSNELPLKYMISCFWEGQEGSFLLWMIWHSLIGVILVFRAGNWESPVMAVIALAQIALSTMLLGIGEAPFKIGSSPFELTRMASPDLLQAPVLQSIGQGNYLQVLKNGNGLNPLLQNYWMVIHPPTLFLGFATAIVPFAYAIAGLWTGRLRQWMSPALIWGLICVAVLGTGIIMGGFWAYEALSFGGYWAWDPVENASLMPWLLLISAMHMVLITRATGRHLVTTILLVCISFFLVLYATFLTRSGILGDASVHSFTDLGMSGQLLLFLFLFIFLTALVSFPTSNGKQWFTVGFVLLVFVNMIPPTLETAGITVDPNFSLGIRILDVTAFVFAMFLFVRNLLKQQGGDVKTEEHMLSRELWMLAGSLAVVLSLIQVFLSTSNPVWNKLFGLNLGVLKANDYNQIQLWLAMPIALFMAVSQFLSYRKTPASVFKRDAILSFSIAMAVTVISNFIFRLTEVKYWIFLLLAVYVVVGNILVLVRMKQKGLLGGASIAHAGFGMLLVGVLISSVNKQVLSSVPVDPSVQAPTLAENITLFRGKTAQMGEYAVTYNGFDDDGLNKYFRIHFRRGDSSLLRDSFTLKPIAQNNPKMGLLAEPDTRHYLWADLFTHVSYESSLDKEEPFSGFRSDTFSLYRTKLSADGMRRITLDSVLTSMEESTGTIRVQPLFRIETADGEHKAGPFHEYRLDAGLVGGRDTIVDAAGMMIRFDKFVPNNANPALSQVIVTTATREPKREYVVLKAILFPFINLVWAGTIIMVIGFSMAVWRRIGEYNKQRRG
jgi:cytochrome c-type biogenesis protein CcmF